jgi:hypothetical protein
MIANNVAVQYPIVADPVQDAVDYLKRARTTLGTCHVAKNVRHYEEARIFVNVQGKTPKQILENVFRDSKGIPFQVDSVQGTNFAVKRAELLPHAHFGIQPQEALVCAGKATKSFDFGGH